MNTEDIRKEFPILEQLVYGRRLVYLDNAATSQRPLSVVKKWEEITLAKNANLHRAVHKLASDATDEYESTRKIVADFVNASSPSEIVFTSGATASINLLAFSYGELAISEGDEIIIGEAEHHSNIVPWQMLAARKKAVIKVLPVDENGNLRTELLNDLIVEGRTKIVCVGHVSNVLGIINPLKEIVRISHSRNCPVMVDGAQGIVHTVVDVQDIDCDFYVFSGHKLYAASGTGVFYAKEKWMKILPPYMGGGEMISVVKWSGTTYAEAPHKFEAGTQNIAGVPTLKPAIDFAVAARDTVRDETLVKHFIERIRKDNRIRLYGLPTDLHTKIPLFSITVDGAHHEDLALILDKMGIAARSGQMCAEPLMDKFGVTGMLRVSFAPYNTIEEADYFVESLEKAIKMLL